MRDERRLAEPPRPERRKATMRRSGDRILANANRWREESRHEIATGRRRSAGHDDAARLHIPQARQVWLQIAHDRLVRDFNQAIETAATHVPDARRIAAERLQQSGRRCDFLCDDRRKIKLDPPVTETRRQWSAARLEADGLGARNTTGLVQYMRAGQRPMAAQLELGRCREPAKPERAAVRVLRGA